MFDCILGEIQLRINDLIEKVRSNLYTYRKKQDARTSIVWDFFHIIVDEIGNDVEQFYYCIN